MKEALLEPFPDSVPDCTELVVSGEETDESVGDAEEDDEEEEETGPEPRPSLDEEGEEEEEEEEEAAELKNSIE